MLYKNWRCAQHTENGEISQIVQQEIEENNAATLGKVSYQIYVATAYKY